MPKKGKGTLPDPGTPLGRLFAGFVEAEKKGEPPPTDVHDVNEKREK